MLNGVTCVDCKREAPPTNTENTLISAQHGWRLLRKRLDNGGVLLEWRCGLCWSEHKARTGVVSSPTPGPAPPSSGQRG
jgi:hypothetical protein